MNQPLLHLSENGRSKLDERLEGLSVWLSQMQLAPVIELNEPPLTR